MLESWLTSLSAHYPRIFASVAAVADFSEQLQPGEASSLVKARENRKRQFSTGRYLCRRLLPNLGCDAECKIPVGAQRAPVWPRGIVGSISHTNEVCVAMVAPRDRYDGVGLDLEQISKSHEELWDYVTTELERDSPRSGVGVGRQVLTILFFSAKEAVFKAVHPIAGEFLEFQDVRICFDWSSGRFTAACCNHPISDRHVRRGMGRFSAPSDHICTAFVIPTESGASLRSASPGELLGR